MPEQTVVSEYNRHRWITESAVQGTNAHAWVELGYPDLAGQSATNAARYAFMARPELRRQTES